MKKTFTILIAAIAAILLIIQPLTALATDAEYVFNTSAGLGALGITVPSQGSGTNLSGTYKVGNITMSFTNGSTNTRIWNKKGTLTLRVYTGGSGGSLTFTADNGYNITAISVGGSAPVSANVGTYSNGSWSGSSTSVTLTATATTDITTITVTYSAAGNYITVAPTTKNVTCAAQDVEFTITTDQTLDANPIVFYSTSAGTGDPASTPSWIGSLTSAYNSSTKKLTVPVTANSGAAHTAYFRVEKGSVKSDVVTLTQAVYTPTAPTLPATSNFDYEKEITITVPSGTTVYYTLDGSTPSSGSTAYSAPFTINATMTVKAIAYDNGYSSEVVSATYTRLYHNISSINSTSTYYTVKGTVVATSTKGFVFGDATGYVYDYYSSSTIPSVGSVVSISGKKVSLYGCVYEFKAESSSASNSSYDPEDTPIEMDGDDLYDVINGSTNYLSTYVQFEGNLSHSTYYQIAVTGNSHNATASISNPTSSQTTTLSGLTSHKVRVKGYFTGVASSAYTVMLESIEDLTPVVAVSPTSLSNFTYNYGSGPSDAQTISVSGSNLTADITVTASDNYVVSTDNSTYGSSVTLTKSSGSVSETTVYVKLKVGLNSGTYNSESDKITVSSTGATSKTVALSGSVTHAIDYETPDNGTLSGNTAAAYGSSVTITAEPESGYKLGSWNITKTSDGSSAGITPVIASGNDYTITMPDFDITVNATFVPAYTITVTNSTPDGGSVYTTPTSAGEGEEITITITPNSGYDLNTMDVVNNTTTQSIPVTNNKFNMPASNVTITVSFIATYTITYDKNGESVTGTAPVDASSPYHSGATVTVLGKGDLEWEGHTFSRWNTASNGSGDYYSKDETFTISANTTLYAQWTTNSYAYTLNLTGQDGEALAELYNGNTEIGENEEIPYGTQVTVVVACGNSYAYAIKVKNNSTGAYLTVTNDKFTMPASAVTVTVITDLVATLTSDDMANVTNAGTTYGTGSDNFKTVTAADGFYWEANAFQSTNQTNFLQINTPSNDSYIKLPVFPGKIEKINFSVTNGSGNNTTNRLYINTTISTSNTIANSENTSSKTRTIDMTNVFCNTGYIVSNGAIRITNISVKYRPYQDMAGSEITTIEPDVTVSIPEDASVSATNLTIPASSGLTIKSGATLTVNGTITNSGNANNLVIEDGGQLILADDKSVAATVKKTVNKPTGTWGNDDASGWYAISSPVGDIAPGSVTNMVLPAVSTVPQYDLYRYDEDMGWYNAQASTQSIATLEKGHGYLYARNANASLSYAGTVTSASFDIKNLSKSVVKHSGLHLIGNPYTHDIYLGTAITGDLTTTGYYALNASGSWISTANTTPIKPEQAVFVFVTKDDATISFRNLPSASKAHHDYISFTVANSQYEDVTYAMFDKGNGLNKIEHRNSEAPMIYIPQDDTNYAIAMMEDNTQMFGLNFKAATTGRYTLSFDTKGEYNYLHVIDRLTGTDTDMLLEGEYSFIGSPMDSESRFIVKLAYNPGNGEVDNDIFAYQNGNDIIVNGEGELQVFDVMGRMVMTTNVNGIETINVKSQGVYIFRLNGMTQKIVVR